MVREICSHLPEWVTPLIDEHWLTIGDDLERSLEAAVRYETDCLLLFVGHDTAQSTWVATEVGWALDKDPAASSPTVLTVLLPGVTAAPAGQDERERVQLRLLDTSKHGVQSFAHHLGVHLGHWMANALRRSAQSRTAEPSSSLTPTATYRDPIDTYLADLPAEWRTVIQEIVVDPFLARLISSRIGRVPLDSEQYYQRILHEVDEAGHGWQITAVSTLSSGLWIDDVDQALYAERNLEARRRHVAIRRLFIVDEDDLRPFRPIIEEQTDAGVSVSIAPTTLVARFPTIEDMVVFAGPYGTRAYISHPTIDGSQRVRSGELILDPATVRSLLTTFEHALRYARSPQDVFNEPPPGASDRRLRPAPGQNLASIGLSVSEAAPPHRRVNTRILRSRTGFIAVHLPGDATLSLAAVSDRVESAQPHLLEAAELFAAGLEPGAVSAILEPVWSMHHLISRRILSSDRVVTSDGTTSGSFEFDSAILLETPTAPIVGDFEAAP